MVLTARGGHDGRAVEFDDGQLDAAEWPLDSELEGLSRGHMT